MCFSGFLCGDNHTARPWWPTEERLGIPATEKVFTDCCYRRVRAMDTVCRVRLQEMPVGGAGFYQEPLGFGPFPEPSTTWMDYASYYDAAWQIECNPDGGCKVNPHKKLGMHLRAPFYG